MSIQVPTSKNEPVSQIRRPSVISSDFSLYEASRDNLERKDRILWKGIDSVQRASAIDRIGISSHDRITLLNPEEVYYLTAERNYTVFELADRSILVSKSIGEYEEVLAPYQFFRIHRSTIINLHHLREVRTGRQSQVIMDHGIYLNLARGRRDALIEVLKEVAFY